VFIRHDKEQVARSHIVLKCISSARQRLVDPLIIEMMDPVTLRPSPASGQERRIGAVRNISALLPESRHHRSAFQRLGRRGACATVGRRETRPHGAGATRAAATPIAAGPTAPLALTNGAASSYGRSSAFVRSPIFSRSPGNGSRPNRALISFWIEEVS
jgi:hypothetical protein